MTRATISKREQRRRLRERAKFWDRNAERLKLWAIGGGAVLAMLVVMKAVLQ